MQHKFIMIAVGKFKSPICFKEMYFAVSNKNCNFAVILMAVKLTTIKLFEYDVLR